MGIEWQLHEAAETIIAHVEGSIDPVSGEISDEALSELDILNLDFERFVGAAGSAYRQMIKKSKAYKAEAKLFADKAMQQERNAERLRQTVLEQMNKLRMTKVSGPWGSATVQESTPKLEITGDVPEKYLVTPEPQPDKQAIKRALRDMTCDWARLTRSTHVRFR